MIILLSRLLAANLINRPLLGELRVAMVEGRQLSDALPPLDRSKVALEPRVTAVTPASEEFLQGEQ